MPDTLTPGWYILTPGGWAGPYPDRQRAIDCRPPGTSWLISHHGKDTVGCCAICALDEHDEECDPPADAG